MKTKFWRLVLLSICATTLLAGCPSTDAPSDNNGGGADAGGLNNPNGDDTGGGDCSPECQLGARTCADDRVVLRCEAMDGCPTLVEALNCPSYKLCEGGTCVDKEAECTSVCTPGSPARCNDDGEVEQCDDFDADGCYEWGGAQACPSGQYCNPDQGSCEQPDCTDECAAGDTSCEGDLVRTCRQNAQGCMVFGAGAECDAGQICQGGQCQAETTCTDECGSGESVCAADGGVRSCADADGDGCLELSAAQACPSGQECRAGGCVDVASCQDQCVQGETVCVGNQIADCDDHDGDGCTEFSSPHACPSAGDTCSSASGTAACEAAPSSGSGTVVINEIFYDPVGQDVRGSGSSASSPTFIELAGTPGKDVSGYVVRLVNGSNGQDYNSFTLAAGTTLDGNGFAVLAMDVADSYLAYAASSYTNVYYVLTGYATGTDALQNGQDSVVLEDGAGTTVDAVGYGDFSATMQNFAGEGTAVASTISGRSIGRAPGAADTDDNLTDFRSYYPTPGLPNSDLIINEVYPNQPGVDDATQTFIELVAPIQGWEDMPLDGYVVHAINGFDGQDYIYGPNGAGGVDLSGASLNDATSDDGYVVICNLGAEISLLNRCAVPYDGADLQNGPDNVVLRYQGRDIDAIGYGTFGASDSFVGEGDPISYSASDAGYSLGRWPISDSSVTADTDDNFDDFWWLSPTPGTANPRP